ncbi:MAG: PAS domain S-box protein [Ignavibacteriaceae bacterium]|nr:PAS domain S-box protein [Ignavibacteriaceae bacterium]
MENREKSFINSLLDSVIESTADGILVVDSQGIVSKSNKKFAKLWNIPQALIDSKNDKKLLAFILDQLKDPDLFIKKVEELYAKPELESYDILEFKDGRYFERLSFPQKLGDEIVGRVWNFRDITERKHLEKVQQESENKYRDLFEKSGDAHLIISNGNFIDCNEATVKLLRYKNKTELLNTHPSELSPEMQPDGKTSFEKANEMMNIALEKGSHRFEWNHIKADGEVFPVEVLLTTIKIDGENIILHTAWRDITEQKKSERLRDALYQISESTHRASDMEMLYKKIHEVVATLMIVKNIYIAVYDDVLELLSFPYMVDEYDPHYEPKKLGKGLTEYVLRTGEPILVDAEKDLALRESGEVELIGTPTEIWLGVPLKVSGKAIGVIVVQDYENPKTYGEAEKQVLIFVSEQIALVIERKRNSEAIIKYTEELKELNHTKDRFFSIVAHDLKSPFQGLLGYLHILTTEYATLLEEEKKLFIKHIDELSRNTFSLLENLLEWSRIQTGRISFNPTAFNLLQDSQLTISLLKQTAVNKKITLDLSIDEKIIVNADKNMLSTVIRNLVFNAIKFTNAGGKITLSAKPKADLIEISVADTGIGIRQDIVDKLFKIDENVSTKGTANELGTGLGLLLCKELIEKNSGNIRVESKVGKGSKFIFTLPSA